MVLAWSQSMEQLDVLAGEDLAVVDGLVLPYHLNQALIFDLILTF